MLDEKTYKKYFEPLEKWIKEGTIILDAEVSDDAPDEVKNLAKETKKKFPRNEGKGNLYY